MSARSGLSPKATRAHRAVRAPHANSYDTNSRLISTKLLNSGSTIHRIDLPGHPIERVVAVADDGSRQDAAAPAAQMTAATAGPLRLRLTGFDGLKDGRKEV